MGFVPEPGRLFEFNSNPLPRQNLDPIVPVVRQRLADAGWSGDAEVDAAVGAGGDRHVERHRLVFGRRLRRGLRRRIGRDLEGGTFVRF